MLNARTVKDNEVEFRESQAPSCESFGQVRMVEGLLEGVVTSAYCKTIPFIVRLEEEYRLYCC